MSSQEDTMRQARHEPFYEIPLTAAVTAICRLASWALRARSVRIRANA